MTTIKDVARYAGVAPSTVSRVLNGRNWVGDTVRRRVEEAIAALDYRPSSVARSMRVGHTQTLGLVVRDMANPNFAVICTAAEAAAQEHGHTLMVCNSNRSPSKEAQYLDLLVQRHVDGVILFVTDERINNCNLLLEKGTPMVLVDSNLAVGADQVRTDGEQGGYLAARHLLELGHRRIGVLAYRQDLLIGRARLAGVRRAFAELGVAEDPSLTRFCQSSPESACQEALHLLRTQDPTAMLATTVTLTVGALQAVTTLRLRVPEDLSLIGFDETELTTLYRPPLTVVARDVPAMATRAVTMLLERITRTEKGPARLETIPFALKVGGSTALLRQSL